MMTTYWCCYLDYSNNCICILFIKGKAYQFLLEMRRVNQLLAQCELSVRSMAAENKTSVRTKKEITLRLLHVFCSLTVITQVVSN